MPASQAVLNGLAADGGLYVPEEIPKLAVPAEQLAEMSYQDLAYEVMRLFLTDAGYQKFLDSQERGEVKLKNHAKVSGGHLHYDRRDRAL